MHYSWLQSLLNCLLAVGIFNSGADFEKFQASSEIFYDEYLSEQKTIDASVNLGTPGRSRFSPPALPSPPADPPPPTPLAGYLPIVLVNNSGFPDSAVYISVIGTQVLSNGTASTQQMYMTFNGSGVGSYTNVIGSGTVPNPALSTLNTPTAPHTYTIYIPALNNSSYGISGARIYFEINNSTPLITYSGSKLSEPSVTNQSLAPYSIAFDKYEFAYVAPGSPQVAADGTAVDFFCIPLYGYLSTPDAGSGNHSGLYESQSFVMKSVVPYFFNNRCTNGAILAQWNNLFAPTESNPLRVLSPSTAMSVGTGSSFPNKFDPNYFDNAAAYGFSLLEYLWYGSGAYYKTNGLYIAIPASANYPQPSGGYYTATIAGNNQMNFSPAFTTEAQSYLPAPFTTGATAPSPTNGPTSYWIFAALNLNPTFAANLQGNQVSKVIEEAMIAGLLPAPFSPSNPLSNNYLTANSGNYYNNRVNLPANAGGPWYSVYAEAIHYCGPIYAFGFDEPLYPNVLMQCTTPTPATYIGITIGTCDLVH